MSATASCRSRAPATTSGTVSRLRETMNTTPDPRTNPGSVTRPSSTPPARRPAPANQGSALPPDGDQALPVVSAVALSPAQRDEVLQLASAATTGDGVAPLSEHVMLHLRYGGGDGLDLTSGLAGHVTGYAHLEVDGSGVAGGELVVDPAHR